MHPSEKLKYKTPRQSLKITKKGLVEVKNYKDIKIYPFEKGQDMQFCQPKTLYVKLKLITAKIIENGPTFRVANKTQQILWRLRVYKIFPFIPPRLFGTVRLKLKKNDFMRITVWTTRKPPH